MWETRTGGARVFATIVGTCAPTDGGLLYELRFAVECAVGLACETHSGAAADPKP